MSAMGTCCDKSRQTLQRISQSRLREHFTEELSVRQLYSCRSITAVDRMCGIEWDWTIGINKLKLETGIIFNLLQDGCYSHGCIHHRLAKCSTKRQRRSSWPYIVYHQIPLCSYRASRTPTNKRYCLVYLDLQPHAKEIEHDKETLEEEQRKHGNNRVSSSTVLRF